MAISANENKVWGVFVEWVTEAAQSNLLDLLPFGWIIRKATSASKAIGQAAQLAQRVEVQGVDFSSILAPLTMASNAISVAQEQVKGTVAVAVQDAFKAKGIPFEVPPPAATPPGAQAAAPAQTPPRG